MSTTVRWACVGVVGQRLSRDPASHGCVLRSGIVATVRPCAAGTAALRLARTIGQDAWMHAPHGLSCGHTEMEDDPDETSPLHPVSMGH